MMKLINVITIIIIITNLVNAVKVEFNGFIKSDFSIYNNEDNLNFIFPKPKFTTFQSNKLKPKHDFELKEAINLPSLVFNRNTILEFDTKEWTKKEQNHIKSFYNTLFKMYPTSPIKDQTLIKKIKNSNNNYNNKIKIVKIPTMSNLEYTEYTFNDSIPFGFNENYEIHATYSDITIYGNSKFGILNSIKTLFQCGNMVELKEQKEISNKKLLYLFNLPFTIIDKPRLSYRGFLIDTGRYFLTVDYIKQIINSLSLLKMNALHWHITDDQSFPIELPEFPLLHEKGSNHLGYIHNHIKYNSNKSQYYKLKEIKEIVQYGNLMGVRVIPEIDMPSHTLSWSKGYNNLTTSCPNYLKSRYNQINGEYTYSLPLDPSNEFVYTVIKSILNVLKTTFTDPYIHLGFDEIPIDCWLEDQELVNSMFKKNNIQQPSKYLSYFLKRVNNILESLGIKSSKKIIMWEDIIPMLDNEDKLKYFSNNDIIFQLWKGRDEFDKYLKFNNNSFIYSFGNYVDPSYQSCNSYTECLIKQDEIIKEFEKSKLLIGLEACAWEMIPLENIKSLEKDGISKQDRGYPDRVWNRLLAISEKMWFSKPYLISNLKNGSKGDEDEVKLIKDNSITRAKKFIVTLDQIINNQNLINSKKTINKLF